MLSFPNIVSEPLKVVPDQSVMDKIKLNEGQIVLCSPVLHELYYGMERLPVSRKRTLILEYINTVILPSFPILPYSNDAAIIHANLRVKLDVSGRTSGYVDSQIASIAITNNLILVTRNTKDFENIENLKVENWFL